MTVNKIVPLNFYTEVKSNLHGILTAWPYSVFSVVPVPSEMCHLAQFYLGLGALSHCFGRAQLVVINLLRAFLEGLWERRYMVGSP